jgi:hypothetical protein
MGPKAGLTVRIGTKIAFLRSFLVCGSTKCRQNLRSNAVFKTVPDFFYSLGRFLPVTTGRKRPKADDRNHLLQPESRQLRKVSPIHEVLRHLRQQE